MPPELVTVPAWRGITDPDRASIQSDRKQLDVPRDLLNVHVTEQGKLWLPPAAYEQLASYSSSHVPIVAIARTDIPRGVFVQTSEGVFFYDTFSIVDPNEFPTEVQVLDDNDINHQGWPFWFNSFGTGGASPVYMGYAPRGVGAEPGQTWRVEYNDSDPIDGLTVTELTEANDNVPWASDSVIFKGRRFISRRSNRVMFSELNEPEDFDMESGDVETTDNKFEVGGDFQGTNWQDFPGDVQGMIAFEDQLVIFLSNTVWTLHGAGPETFQLRQAETEIGAQQFSAAQVPGGIIYVGGDTFGDFGIYQFTGSSARKISDPVERFLRTRSGVLSVRQGGLSWAGRYIWTIPRTQHDRQVYIYNFNTRDWTTFGGYGDEGPVVGAADQASLLIADGTEVRRYRESSSVPVWPRRPGQHGHITLGWHDDENPTGFVRFLGVKLSGWWSGEGNAPQITLTARTPNGGEWSDTKTLPDKVFDGMIFPMQLRGNGLEIDLELKPEDDTQEILLETLQLISSRKGEKLSRR